MKAWRTLCSFGEGGSWLRKTSQDIPQLAAESFICPDALLEFILLRNIFHIFIFWSTNGLNMITTS